MSRATLNAKGVSADYAVLYSPRVVLVKVWCMRGASSTDKQRVRSSTAGTMERATRPRRVRAGRPASQV